MNKRQKKKSRKQREEHGHWHKTTVHEMFKDVENNEQIKMLVRRMNENKRA